MSWLAASPSSRLVVYLRLTSRKVVFSPMYFPLSSNFTPLMSLVTWCMRRHSLLNRNTASYLSMWGPFSVSKRFMELPTTAHRPYFLRPVNPSPSGIGTRVSNPAPASHPALGPPPRSPHPPISSPVSLLSPSGAHPPLAWCTKHLGEANARYCTPLSLTAARRSCARVPVHDVRSDRHAARVCSSSPTSLRVLDSTSQRFSARLSTQPWRAFSADLGSQDGPVLPPSDAVLNADSERRGAASLALPPYFVRSQRAPSLSSPMLPVLPSSPISAIASTIDVALLRSKLSARRRRPPVKGAHGFGAPKHNSSPVGTAAAASLSSSRSFCAALSD
mmetsp:Transcript_9198/g.22631  ORF Transcript_9198/g.22631 Transcript_9198/m.22631 type:complete len:333 (-) Transcript_9198:47-1045(-)